MRAVVLGLALTLAAAPASAENRYAVIVTGAPGGDAFVPTYTAWTNDLRPCCGARWPFPPRR